MKFKFFPLLVVLSISVIEIEVADKMTNPQVFAKIRKHFPIKNN